MKSRLHRARVSLRAILVPALAGAEPMKPSCRAVAEHFSRWLDRDLGPSTCAELKAHLKRCRGCRQACASLQEVLRVCRQSPRADLRALKRSLQRAVRQIRTAPA